MGKALTATVGIALRIEETTRTDPDLRGVTWLVGRSETAVSYNMVSDRERDPTFAQVLVNIELPRATARMLSDLLVPLSERAVSDGAHAAARAGTEPSVDAPAEPRFMRPDLATQPAKEKEPRAITAAQPQVTVDLSAIISAGSKLQLNATAVRARQGGDLRSNPRTKTVTAFQLPGTGAVSAAADFLVYSCLRGGHCGRYPLKTCSSAGTPKTQTWCRPS